jgi:hypothetical protein
MKKNRQGSTHHGGAGDVGASDDSLDSQEAPRKLHDNNGVLGFFRNAISGPEIGTMVALNTSKSSSFMRRRKASGLSPGDILLLLSLAVLAGASAVVLMLREPPRSCYQLLL